VLLEMFSKSSRVSHSAPVEGIQQVDAPLIFFSQCNLSLSIHLVLQAPMYSCSLYFILFIWY